MPHIAVKLWPGKTEKQKRELADAISASVIKILGVSVASVSVGFQEVSSSEWADKVFRPEIASGEQVILKKPGYSVD